MATETAPTHDELYDIAKAPLQAAESSLSILDGDISDLLLLGVAAMGDHIVGYADRGIKRTYFDGAEKEALDTLIDDHLGLPRNEAQRAYGEITVTRVSAAAGAGTIFAGHVFATDFDTLGATIEYVALVDQAWGGAEVGSKTLQIEAIYPGRSGNVAINRVRRIVSSLWDSTFTITNAAAIAGGSDDETDPQYRERGRGYSSTIRRATLAALEYGAKQNSTGVVNATAHENTSTGIVDLYVSDAAGGSNPTMVSNVVTELRNWRAAGIPLNVLGGTLLDPTIALTIGVRPGVSQTELAPKLQVGLAAWSDRLKVGETLILGELIAAVFALAPDALKVVEAVVSGAGVISSPIATYGLVPTLPTQKIRILAGNVSFTAWGTIT